LIHPHVEFLRCTSNIIAKHLDNLDVAGKGSLMELKCL
jgi:hypothetical protein